MGEREGPGGGGVGIPMRISEKQENDVIKQDTIN